MAPPDLNSLPASRSMSSSPIQPRSMQSAFSPPNGHESPSPRITSVSLATTATLNNADVSRRSSVSNRGSPQLGRMPSNRRRSQIAMHLNLNDPTIPSPGELPSSDRRSSISHSFSSMSPSTLGGRGTIATGDPHHQRQPSLGDIHNELEQEQEAQVNRMLQMIREQQLQLDALQRTPHEQPSRRSSQPNPATPGNPGNGTAIDDLTPGSERSAFFSSTHPAIPSGHTGPPPRRISRHPSSASRSPALRPSTGHENSVSSMDSPSSPFEHVRRNSFRDESAFYQAETATLTRENQMLRMRIRELEKQVGETNAAPANTPSVSSNLASSVPVDR